MPASLISAMAAPWLRRSRICGPHLLRIVLVIGRRACVLMAKRSISLPEVRVSSHSTVSAAASVASARIVMSPRLPMGVATT